VISFVKSALCSYNAFLHEVYEENALWAGHVCLSIRPSVRMIQLENHWTNIDENWYGRCAIEITPKSLL
jgi:hypothetical protein